MRERFAMYVIEYSPGCYCVFDHGKKPWQQEKYTFTWGIEYATQFPLPYQAKLALQHVQSLGKAAGAKIVRVEYEVVKAEYRELVAR